MYNKDLLVYMIWVTILKIKIIIKKHKEEFLIIQDILNYFQNQKNKVIFLNFCIYILDDIDIKNEDYTGKANKDTFLDRGQP